MNPAAHYVPRLATGIEIHRPTPNIVRLRSAPFPRRGWHATLARWLGFPERLELELDDLGAWVIERCDGRNVATLAGELAAHVKLSEREAEVALGDFLRQLVGRRLVVIHQDVAT
jgi:hypothetical protein